VPVAIILGILAIRAKDTNTGKDTFQNWAVAISQFFEQAAIKIAALAKTTGTFMSSSSDEEDDTGKRKKMNPDTAWQQWLRSWLLDFRFRNIQVHRLNRLFWSIVYVFSCIVTIIFGIWVTFALLAFPSVLAQFGINVGNTSRVLMILIGIPLNLIITFLSIIGNRLVSELCVIWLDWMVYTTKAARIFIDNNEEEE